MVAIVVVRIRMKVCLWSVLSPTILYFASLKQVGFIVAGRLQTGSSKVFNAMLDLEKKVLSGRSVGDNTDREQKGSQADKIEVTRHSPDCTLSLSPSPCAYAEASSASVRLRPHAVAEAFRER